MTGASVGVDGFEPPTLPPLSGMLSTYLMNQKSPNDFSPGLVGVDGFEPPTLCL